MVRGGQLYYVLPDHLGRPEMLTDDTGTNVVWRARLAAFDRHVMLDQVGGYHLGFPGQYHDSESGFAYNIFRDYDPATGRYLQSDPIGLLGGTNTYLYARGGPTLLVDPFGLVDISLSECNAAEIGFHANRNDPNDVSLLAHGPFKSKGQKYVQGCPDRWVAGRDGAERRTSREALVKAILNHPKFKSATSISLWVCHSAEGEDSLIQYIANETGLPTSGFWGRGTLSYSGDWSGVRWWAFPDR
jgi:RHS repeat-associated protein